MILSSRGLEIVMPRIRAMIRRGIAWPNSFRVMLSVPSPLPVLETIKRSRLNISAPQQMPKIHDPIVQPMVDTSSPARPFGPKAVLNANPPAKVGRILINHV